jgi:hypothetical protein
MRGGFDCVAAEDISRRLAGVCETCSSPQPQNQGLLTIRKAAKLAELPVQKIVVDRNGRAAGLQLDLIALGFPSPNALCLIGLCL